MDGMTAQKRGIHTGLAAERIEDGIHAAAIKGSKIFFAYSAHGVARQTVATASAGLWQAHTPFI